VKQEPEKIPEVEIEELEEEELEVKRVVVGGTTYFRSENGKMYDIESSDLVGHWDEESQSIV